MDAELKAAISEAKHAADTAQVAMKEAKKRYATACGILKDVGIGNPDGTSELSRSGREYARAFDTFSLALNKWVALVIKANPPK